MHATCDRRVPTCDKAEVSAFGTKIGYGWSAGRTRRPGIGLPPLGDACLTADQSAPAFVLHFVLYVGADLCDPVGVENGRMLYLSRNHKRLMPSATTISVLYSQAQ